MPEYDTPLKFPERVWQAVEKSRADAFPLACIPEVGRLLQMFAGLRGIRSACELGTAYGVGAAWIESGLALDAHLLTVEIDPHRTAAASSVFVESRAVTVVNGDWTAARPHAPFDLLFSDGGPKRNPGDPELLPPLVRTGGLVVLDDYTPGRPGPDVSRQIWFESSLFVTVELTVAPSAAVLVARRRPTATG